MNKTVLKIFVSFSVMAALISVVLLGINFISFACLQSDTFDVYDRSAKTILSDVSSSLYYEGDRYLLRDETAVPQDSWCILIDQAGAVIWSMNKPEEIPTRYSINDIARMTRWYLEDYPVYVRTEEYGLLVLGFPKDAVGKYDLEFTAQWFDTLPQRIAKIFAGNLLLAVLLAILFGVKVYKRLKELTSGMRDLRNETPVVLEEKGILKELARTINDTSAAISRKNAILAERDSARQNWVAGISHDIRTPLAIVTGNAEAIEQTENIPEQVKQRAGAIVAQSMRIKNLIADLNLMSAIEYDMQPGTKQRVPVCPFMRNILSNIINGGLADSVELIIDLTDEKACVEIDVSLMERAIMNLVHNCITHNPEGCRISVNTYRRNGCVYIVIADDGNGVPAEVLETISDIPKAAHGLGLPMAYKIVAAHGGTMTAKNENGFMVTISLPAAF